MSFTPNQGVVLSDQSTSSALNAGVSWNASGSFTDVSMHNSIIVAPATDQDGELVIEFSTDGTNVDSTLTENYYTDRIFPPRRYTVGRQYVRVSFENTSASNQTYLRIQTLAGDKTQLNFPLDGLLAQNADASVVRSMDHAIDVGLGRWQGHVNWHKWGYNDDVDNAASEWIWSYGGNLTPMTSAETLDIVSSSTADDAGSTGLTNIRLVGVGPGRVYQTEDVELDGTTTVTTSNTWLGINRIAPIGAGTGLVNAGNITIDSTTSATVQAYIPAGLGVTQQAFFFVPAERQFFATWLRINVNKISGGASPRVTVQGWVRDFQLGVVYLVFQEVVDTDVENNIAIPTPIPFAIPEQSLLYFTASTNTNNTVVNLRFAGEEVQNA